MHTVGLLTPSHSRDVERFALLCESIDAHVTGFSKHYVIVNDDDAHVFEKFRSDKRLIVPVSRYLPNWLYAVPTAVLPTRRRIWLSLRSAPVHGWHIQQIAKIAGSLSAPEQRMCIIDSDNVFFRKFDVGLYAGAEKAPLYIDRGAILIDAPLHAAWLRNCDHLLGLPKSSFPADDFVGNVLIWDKESLKDMTNAIHQATGKKWALALCRTRPFSEYLLYGRFVTSSPLQLARHMIVEHSLAAAHWSENQLDRSAVKAMIRKASPGEVALCIQSYSSTSLQDIRCALLSELNSGD